MSFLVPSRRGGEKTFKPFIMRAGSGFGKTKTRARGRYILNNVKHIQDYYAPVIGEFEQLTLLALTRLGNGAYGATIRREIQDRTNREVAIGTVYMTLARLEAKKMICSYIGDPSRHRGGRRRKHYLIDAEGQRALGRAHRTWKAMTAGIEHELDQL